MSLKLYDTMAREKRPFVPADPERVTMYVCGPTVYGYAHIGNARPVVVFDVLFRLLRHLYGQDQVVYARNVTDVDDKINRKAADEGVDIRVITDRYLAAYEADMGALGALTPTLQPRATENIEAMLAQIGALIERGCAYAAEGHVLFDTQSFPDYGRLSGRPLDEMVQVARVDPAPYKRHPADFVLWKPSKPGEPEWPSPWGAGRPGWHIECSAMIEAVLGLPIDIHGGGIDLQFPHHENELAQGVCAHGGGEYARYWMHNGFLDMAGEKMSKSLGNVIIPHDLLKVVPGEVLRWALLSAHYRQPLDWTGELISQSRATLDRFYQLIRDALAIAPPPPDGARPTYRTNSGRSASYERFVEALKDDLNTPSAMAALGQIAASLRLTVSKFGKEHPGQFDREVWGDLEELLDAGRLLGFLQTDPNDWFEQGVGGKVRERIEKLVEERALARSMRNWEQADQIRRKLDRLWVQLEEGSDRVTWRKQSDPKEFERVSMKALEQFGFRFSRSNPASESPFDFNGIFNDGNAFIEVKRDLRGIKNKLSKHVVYFKEWGDKNTDYFVIVSTADEQNRSPMRSFLESLRSDGIRSIGLLVDIRGNVVGLA